MAASTKHKDLKVGREIRPRKKVMSRNERDGEGECDQIALHTHVKLSKKNI